MPANANALRQAIIRWGDRTASAWERELLNAMRQDAPKATPTGDPRQRPPGTLRRAMRTQPVLSVLGRRGFKVVAPGIEARTTALGARPHVIRPKRRGGVLVFYVGGQKVIRRGPIQHPGNMGTDWFRKSLRKHGQGTLVAAARRARF